MPEAPETVLVAVPQRGLRFDLTRELLARGFYATLMSDGECAARLVGSAPRMSSPPVAIVAECRSALGVRRLLRRVEELRWDPSTLIVIDPPDEVRAELRRRGARIIDDPTGAEPIYEHIAEALAA